MGKVGGVALQGSVRRKIRLLLLFFLFYTMTSGLPADAADGPPACQPSIARVVSIQGPVDVQRAGQAGWSAVTRLDTPLCNGDRLRTGRLSRSALFVQPESLVRVDQNTTISVGQTAEETLIEFYQDDVPAADSRQHCGAGYFISRFPKKFRVNTPFFNAAVEGTEFLVAMRCVSAELSVLEGKVLASGGPSGSNLPTRSVGSGETLSVGGAEPPAIKLLLKPADAVQWTLYYPPITPAGFAPVEDCRVVAPDIRVSCLIARAEQLLRAGRVEEAQANIGDALAAAPASSDAKALSSIISLVRNDKAEALRQAKEAVETTDKSAPAWLALSYARQADFKLEAALTSAQRAAELTPSALALARVAELQLSLGWTREAEKTAKQAVAANPSESRAHMIRGFVHLAQIKVNDAREDFQRAIELDSTDPLSRLGLGLAIIREGKLVEGREQIEIAVALDPTNSLIRSYVGKAYYEENTKQRDQLAATQFGLANELDANDPTPWFYDAILKQTRNQPAEALEDLQKSIELNDKRAVYRSKLLLDQDDAARMSTAAGVYQELGFEQQALLQGALAVAADPQSPGAHRFLADIYSTLPGYETARESQLLQSQLRQPLSPLPTAPLRSQQSPGGLFARSHLLTAAGPTKVSLGEFSPLFLGNGAALYIDSLVGSFDTFGGQAVATGLYGPLGLSVGYGHFQTEEFGTSTNVHSNAYDASFQVQLTPSASIQAEVLSFRDKRAESTFTFDPASATAFTLDDSISRSRIGARYAISPSSEFLLSAFHQERTSNFFYPSFDLTDVVKTKADSQELQYLAALGPVDLTMGAGHYDTLERHSSFEIPASHDNAYGYAQLSLADSAVRLQFGLSVDHLDDTTEKFERKEVNPKLGLILIPSPGTTIRAASFQTVKRQLIASQTLEPTQVAGFNQFFDDPNGTIARELAIAMDQRVGQRFDVGVEGRQRQLTVPLTGTVNGFDDFDWQEREVRAYAYLVMPKKAVGVQPLSCTGSLKTELVHRELRRQDLPDGAGISSLDTQLFSIGVGAYCSSGVSVQITPTYIKQSGVRQAFSGADSFPIDNSFWMTNVAMAYLLPRRLGRIVVGINNLLDKHVDVLTTDPFLPVFPTGRFVYIGLSLGI